MKIKRTERGWAGHFCAASGCGYRRNTLLEYGDKKVIVSSVGAYMPEYGNKFEQIGWNRYYETMVFYGKEEGGYIEADVSREIGIESEWGIFGENVGELSETVDSDMDKIHEGVIKEVIGKMKKGEI